MDFKCIPAHIDEHHAGYTVPHKIVQSIALRKAQAVAKEHPRALVIGCDTIVVLSDGTISLKPKDKAAAKRTIQMYQNSYCRVYSGLAIVSIQNGVEWVGYEKARIQFNSFSDKEIEAYLEVGNWKQSSGSLTLEEVMPWVKKIEGDYFNILGLPIYLLKKGFCETGAKY